MDYVHDEFKHNGHLIKIVHDEGADNPIDSDDCVKVVAWHRSYDIGTCDNFSSPEEFEEFCKETKVHRLPVYLLDHSGVTVSTAPFGCSWDSGQVGWVFVTDERAKEELRPDDPDAEVPTYDKALKSVVEEIDTWLTGNVWGYVIYKLCHCCGEPRNVVDSCWGFYGDPDEYVREEAMNNVPDLPKGTLAI